MSSSESQRSFLVANDNVFAERNKIVIVGLHLQFTYPLILESSRECQTRTPALVVQYFSHVHCQCCLGCKTWTITFSHHLELIPQQCRIINLWHWRYARNLHSKNPLELQSNHWKCSSFIRSSIHNNWDFLCRAIRISRLTFSNAFIPSGIRRNAIEGVGNDQHTFNLKEKVGLTKTRLTT